MNTKVAIESLLKGLNLLGMKEVYEDLANKCSKQTHIEYLYELATLETDIRQQKHVLHLLKLARLPRNKLLIDFELSRIPGLNPALVQSLSEGTFIDRCQNLLLFGNPGSGKTHLAIALAREWCQQGRRCLYISAANLVQHLATHKKNGRWQMLLKFFDRKEVLIIDDISYVPYDKTETDLLFLLLAERYEQRSTVITSNLAFSGWNKIFKDDMTTAAAIDRLVHHAIVLELNAKESYRVATAKKHAIHLNGQNQQPQEEVTQNEQ